MVLIILSFGFRSWLMPFARLAGLLSLAFTLVRTSWGGLAVALVMIVLGSGRKAIGYALGIVLGSVALIFIVTSVPQINEAITQRVDTFQDLQQDGSLLDREQEAERMLTLIAENPLGVGVGTLGRGTVAAGSGQILFTGPIDDGFLEIFGSLGWLFGFLYCGALFGMAALSFRGAPGFAQEIRVTRAAAIAALAALPFTNIAVSVTGVVMWTMFAVTGAIASCAAPRERSAPVPQSFGAASPAR
jgi:putative inorganic carbon (hco3(-)) transporter